MKFEKTELFAYVFLIIGVILLIFTFYMAFALLIANLSFLQGQNLSEALGDVLGPIAEALIKILYLGVMGWVGSIITIRGIQLLKEAREDKKTLKLQPEPVKETKPKKAEEKEE